MLILIVEDEISIANALSEILQSEGYMTECVHDGQTALDYISIQSYDLIILDVMLPIMDGYTVVKKIREKNINYPVLMLTARTTIPDKVNGLNSGADDYMTKPFDIDELIARVKALTRRKGIVIMDILTFGDLSLNLNKCELECNNNSVKLSYKEFKVAQILFSNPNTISSTDILIEKVWGIESNATSNNVEAYISFLRKKIKFLNSSVTIKHINKIGYSLEE